MLFTLPFCNSVFDKASCSIVSYAATFDDINQSSVFLKQAAGSDTCTLVSAAMMLRRTAILRGDSNWEAITESSLRSTAWKTGAGLYLDFTYSNIHVQSGTLDRTESRLISLLNEHPEGIVLYNPSSPHAVLLTDYTNGTFYCADPASGIAKGRIKLTNSYQVRVNNATRYWYVSSPKVKLEPEKHEVKINYNANGGVVASDSKYYIGSNDDIYRKEDNKLMGSYWPEGYTDKYGLVDWDTIGLTREGCDFLGWSKSKDGNSTIWKMDDSSVSANDLYPEITEHSGSVTLYAQWGGHELSEKEGAGQTIPDGDYWITNALSPCYLVDIPGDNYDTKDETNVQMHLWDNDNFGEYDVFTIKYLNNGFYSIIQRSTNMAIDLYRGDLRHRTNIQMCQARESKKNQQWSIKRTNNGYMIQSRANGLYFDVKTDNTNNSNLHTFEETGLKSQYFSFIPYNVGKTVEDGVYRIGTSRGADVYMDASGKSGESKNNTNIQIYDKSTDNYFRLEYCDNGFYKIYDYESGLVLDVNNPKGAEYLVRGANVQLYTDKSNAGQYWAIKPTGDGYYYIISKLNGYYLDLSHGNTENGTNILVWFGYGDNQKWSFISEHKFGEWEVSQAPTQTSEGTLSHTCSICGEEETQPIPAVPFDGNGTQDDPYQITSKKGLETMRDLINNTSYNLYYGHVCYIQTADIDLENESWISIGLGYDDTPDGELGLGNYNCVTRMFFGKYDGGNHYIYNLNADRKLNVSGLFGYIRGSLSNVSNLVVYGSVKNSTSHAGGITETIHYGASIKNCAFIGDIQAPKCAGGIAGSLYAGGEISNCYHNGTVTSESGAGGITSTIDFGKYGTDGDKAVIQNCYHANGLIIGNSCAGVIACACNYCDGIKNYVYINNCYGTSDSGANAIVNNATSDTTLLLRASEMKKAAVDLGTAYTDNTDSSLNNGYPVFTWQIRVAGDISQDGVISVEDVIVMQKYLHAKQKITKAQFEIADMNGDGKVNVFDMVFLKRELLKKEA